MKHFIGGWALTALIVASVLFVKSKQDFANSLAVLTELVSDYREGIDRDGSVAWSREEAAAWYKAAGDALSSLPQQSQAFLERVEKLEAWALADQAERDFDCPHDAEHRCRCGQVAAELNAETERLRMDALTKPGQEGK